MYLKINFLHFPVQHHVTVRTDLRKASSSSLCCCITEYHNLSIYSHASQFHLLLLSKAHITQWLHYWVYVILKSVLFWSPNYWKQNNILEISCLRETDFILKYSYWYNEVHWWMYATWEKNWLSRRSGYP